MKLILEKAPESLYPAGQRFGCIPEAEALALPGRELFAKMLSGEIPPPPIYHAMNIELIGFEEGQTRFRGRPGYPHYNPIGTVHGGWSATMLDTAMASCIHTLLPAGTGLATAEFKVNIVRPLTEATGDVFCEGKVIHFGRTMATSEARLTTAEGKLLAHGVETCSIFPVGPKPGRD